MEAHQNRFTDELLKDVVPFVERTYRVKPGRENRALAGLSMGGGQTLRVLTSHPDEFSQVAIWSAGLFGGNAEDWEKQNESFLASADKVNGPAKRLDIVVGDQDFALAGSKALAEVLAKHGIKHQVRITGGGHTWINWDGDAPAVAHAGHADDHRGTRGIHQPLGPGRRTVAPRLHRLGRPAPPDGDGGRERRLQDGDPG